MAGKHGEKGHILSDLEARPVTLLEETVVKAEESYAKKNGDECIDLWTRAAALARICYGDRHYLYALSHIKAAQCYLEIHGLFDQALYHSKEGLRTIDALTPDDKNLPKTMHINASALCIAGEVLIHQGLLIEAEENLLQAERASGQYSRQTPDGEPDTLLDAKIAVNLGRLCCKQRKFQLGKKCLQKGLELFRSISINDSAVELKLLHELADVEVQLQDYEGAISYLNKANEFSKENFGSSSEEVAEVMIKLAAVHVTILKKGVNSTEENATQAEDLLWNAFGMLSIDKGSAYPKTLSVQDEVVKLYILTERHSEAIKVLRDLIPNKIKAYGEGSMEVARACKVLGSLYLYLGEVTKASQEMKKVREVFVAVLGPNHKESVEVSRTLDALTGSIDGRKVDLLKSSSKTITKD